jgi:hypothetical protein
VKPLAVWQPDAKRFTEPQFCAAYPHPFLVYCVKAGALRPVDRTHGLTIDRAVVAPTPNKDLSSALDDYVALPVRSSSSGRSSEITLGCSHHCDLQINDVSVSKLHAYMAEDRTGWHIRDAASLTGTRVNDLEPGVEPLGSGDRISVGLIDLIFLMPAEVYNLIRRLDVGPRPPSK